MRVGSSDLGMMSCESSGGCGDSPGSGGGKLLSRHDHGGSSLIVTFFFIAV